MREEKCEKWINVLAVEMNQLAVDLPLIERKKKRD